MGMASKRDVNKLLDLLLFARGLTVWSWVGRNAGLALFCKLTRVNFLASFPFNVRRPSRVGFVFKVQTPCCVKLVNSI